MAQSTLPAAPGWGFLGINPVQCAEDAKPVERDFHGDLAPIRPAIKCFGDYFTLPCHGPADSVGGGLEASLPRVPSTSSDPREVSVPLTHQKAPLMTL